MIREKKIISGKLLEIEYYPVSKNGRRIFNRGLKKNKTSDEVKKNNDKNAYKKMLRLAETNFTEKDYYLTLTYADEFMPDNYNKVKLDIKNFFSKISRRLKKQGLPDLKYIYVVECTISKVTGLPRYHSHMIISGDLDRTELIKLWNRGRISKCEHLQKRNDGYEALLTYFTKEWDNDLMPDGRKRFSHSRNLKDPKIRVNDDVYTKNFIEKLCKERIDDKSYWEHKYKGFHFIRCEPEHNAKFNYWRLSVIVRKNL